MIKMELRCPDFYFKVSNINLEEIPRTVNSFDENNYVTSFDENNPGEIFYSKSEISKIEGNLFVRFENYLLYSVKGLEYIERWAEQLLNSFIRESLQDFMFANNINERFLNDDNMQIFYALNHERETKIRENASIVLIDENSIKIVGYYDLKKRGVIKI